MVKDGENPVQLANVPTVPTSMVVSGSGANPPVVLPYSLTGAGRSDPE